MGLNQHPSLRGTSFTLLLTAALFPACSAPAPLVEAPTTPKAPQFTYQDLTLAPPRPVPPAALTKQAVSTDIDRLLFALDRGYGGRGFVAESAWKAMVSGLEKLRNRAASPSELCDHIADALWELPDAHLSSRRRLEGAKASTKCGTLYKAAKRSPSVGKNLTPPETVWSFGALSSGYISVGVFSIQSFPLHEDPAWKRFEKFVAEIPKFDGVVVDLRGNSGGDDSRGYELAEKLFDGKVQNGAVRTHERQTPETLTLALNTVTSMSRADDGSTSPFLAQRVADAQKVRDEAAAHPKPEWKVTPAPALPKPGPNAFKGPIAVLVDADCASSCESTLEVLRLHPNARVFGERTAGFIHFGNIGKLVLPESQIEVNIPTKYEEYPGGKLFDKTGFEPDEATPGKDAFDVAMAWQLGRLPKSEPVKTSDYQVSEADRNIEKERLVKLGLTAETSPVLDKPFAEPLSRRAMVVPQHWFYKMPVDRVYAPALLYDLPALELTMSRAYGGYQVAQSHGWNWEGMFTKWRERLKAAGAVFMPMEKAFAEVAEFEQTQLDNHTGIPLTLQLGGTSTTQLLQSAPSGPCTATKHANQKEKPILPKDAALGVKAARIFNGSTFSNAHYLVRPDNYSPVTHVLCQNEWIAVRAAALPSDSQLEGELKKLAGATEDLPMRRNLTPKIVYMRLPTFTKAAGEKLAKVKATWPKPTGKEKVVLIDLRHNGGGDAAFEALDGFYTEKELERAMTFTRRVADSCLYPALRWGYTAISSGGLTPPLSNSLKRDLQTAYDALFKTDDPACPAKFVEVRGKQNFRAAPPKNAPPKGKPRLVLLVDNLCASDCEYMTSTLQKIQGTLVVGVNTAGVMQFIQPGYSVLPNTRLPYRIALGTSDTYGDNRSTDGYGLDVDIVLDGDEAWSEKGLLTLVQLL
ncbi:MAG: hypothetical protein IPK82_25450 [Polyangiaceae bacterium]|nr:hypothetical protein [Polyangiaceae bacterium]